MIHYRSRPLNTPGLRPVGILLRVGVMRLLDRYLLKELLTALACCLGGFLIFWITFDLFSDLDEFQKAQMSLGQVAHYYLLRLPELLSVVLPVSLLLAMLYALAQHTRHHELTAIRSAGVGVWRMLTPHLLVGVVCSLVLFGANEIEFAEGMTASKQQFTSRVRSGHSGEMKNLNFANARDGRVWHIGRFVPSLREVHEVDVKWNMGAGGSRHLTASYGVWKTNAWVFTNVNEFLYQSSADVIAEPRSSMELRVPELTETPDQILAVMKVAGLTGDQAAKNAQLSLREIANYRRFFPELRAGERALLDTQWHARLASPWTCLVVVLVAIPFAAASGRRNVFVGVASSIFVVFGYFIFMRFGLALGTSGVISPPAAAWSPNLVFGLLGAVFTHKLR